MLHARVGRSLDQLIDEANKLKSRKVLGSWQSANNMSIGPVRQGIEACNWFIILVSCGRSRWMAHGRARCS